MKNKGFTLIELLAVIVILAIIALIATPIILNVIDTAKKGAKESSTLGYIDAVEKQVMLAQVDTAATNIAQGTYTVAQLEALGVKIKGEAPKNDSVITIGEKGQVTNAWVTYEESEYKVYYDGKKAVADKTDYLDDKGVAHNTIATPGTSSVKTYTVGEAIYLNPTNLNTTCNASNSVSTTGTKTGCMKWYVIKDNGNSIDVLLDHNTTATVAYETSGTYKEYAQASIKTQVDSDTTGWTSGLNPRLITTNEVASITNTTTFDGSSSKWFFFNGTGDNKHINPSTSQGDNEYAWLFDYTYNCTSYGCNTADSSTRGYWTSSPASNYSDCAWFVQYDGRLDAGLVIIYTSFGVRPVISVSKSHIS